MNAISSRSLRGLVCAAAAAATALTALAVTPATAHAGTAGAVKHPAVTMPNPATANPTNPLANRPWGFFSGQTDELFNAYRSTSGTDQALIHQIAVEPRARTFGSWYSNDWIQQAVQNYIANVTQGNPDVLVQMAIFRLQPWENSACKTLPTADQQASYRQWIDNFAAGVGTTHAAIVLQPDLPFAFCVPDQSLIPMQLTAYAARVLSALPNTSVYIDAGAADWSPVDRAVYLLRNSGIQYARGFELNSTHFDGTGNQIFHGAAIVKSLAAAGLPGKHFVINTSGNGHPFTHPWYMQHGGTGPGYNSAPECVQATDTHCVTLGIPPTWQVTDPRFKLHANALTPAARFVDGYLWIGKPWMHDQANHFELTRAIHEIQTWPYRAIAPSVRSKVQAGYSTKR
jgi:endoglucanase